MHEVQGTRLQPGLTLQGGRLSRRLMAVAAAALHHVTERQSRNASQQPFLCCANSSGRSSCGYSQHAAGTRFRVVPAASIEAAREAFCILLLAAPAVHVQWWAAGSSSGVLLPYYASVVRHALMGVGCSGNYTSGRYVSNWLGQTAMISPNTAFSRATL